MTAVRGTTPWLPLHGSCAGYYPLPLHDSCAGYYPLPLHDGCARYYPLPLHDGCAGQNPLPLHDVCAGHYPLPLHEVCAGHYPLHDAQLHDDFASALASVVASPFSKAKEARRSSRRGSNCSRLYISR